MIIKYDIEKINRFLYDFYNITGLTVSIWDTEINQLSFKPDIMPDFCRLIRTSELGRRLCLESDRQACSLCKATRAPAPNRCHAGLTDTAIPLILNNQLFGFMMFGQVQGKQDNILTAKDVEKLANRLSLPVDRLYEAYKKLENFDLERINSTANILTSAISYLFDSGSIQYTDSELIAEIKRWISNNVEKPFKISNICAQFSISKNRLYSLWREYYGTTVGKYILDKRMKLAKQLLLTTERKISDICCDVGISDYNYFTKVFKKYYGCTPRAFRNFNTKA